MTVQEWLGADNLIGIDIWEKKYRNGNETFDDWLDRVSGGNNELRALIVEKKFLFGGRILANRGRKNDDVKACLSNCFVLEPPDDCLESIFDTAKAAARTYSYGGGVGIDISKLAPRGAKVNNAAKSSSGAVSFMDLYSKVTESIGQEGRRGAMMLSISCDHPDLLEFIDAKRDLDKITYANTSIRIKDDFMRAVENESPYTLSFTRETSGETITKKINAREVFRKIAQSNWEMGEPGVLFWDRITGYNTMSNDLEFELAGTNPCFTGDMLLLTVDGYRRFDELAKKDSIDVISLDGFISKGRVWANGKKSTVELHLSNDAIIKCTPDHTFMTVNGDECRACDLKGKKLMPFTAYPFAHDRHFVRLGYIQGDGQLSRLKSYTHKGIEVNIGEKDGDIFDLFEGDQYTIKSSRCIYLFGYKELLANMKFSDECLPNRSFPSSYPSLSQAEKAAFLCGCYSANGSIIGKARVSYKTTSKKFADELLDTLTKDFGINGYITTNKPTKVEFANGPYLCKESYDVNISRFGGLARFAECIGFYQNYKRIKLDSLLKERSPYVRSIVEGDSQTVYDFSEPMRHWGAVSGFVAHNCGELPLPSDGACLLGSLNLVAFVKDGEFQYNEFSDAVLVCTQALDDVLDEGISLLPLAVQRDSAKNWRQIGLGVMGLADALIKMGCEYGSGASITLCESIGMILASSALHASANLAEKVGAFPKCDKHAFASNKFLDVHGFSERASKHGLRNSNLLAIAPTGTLSTMLGVSGGIEPIFANSYTRKTESLHGKDAYYKVFTPIVAEYMEKNGLTDESVLPPYFVTAPDIDYEKRIAVQATWQKHIDASISSTINLPNDATVDDIANIYMAAWKAGLKGITVFRDGCKRAGVLTTKEDTPEDIQTSGLPRGFIIPKSNDLVGKIRTLTTGCGSLHVTAFFDPFTGDFVHTFLSKGSQGGCQNFMVGLGRMISLSARGGVSIHDIINQLNSCGSCSSYAVRSATKHDTSKGACCPMAVGNALLEMWMEMQTEVDSDEDLDVETQPSHNDPTPATNPCPSCGNSLVSEGGCNICKACGWSKCD